MKKSISATTKSDGRVLKKKPILLLAAAAIVAFAGYAHTCRAAQSPNSHDKMESMMDSTIGETYNYRFGRALAITDTMIAMYPERPEGYIYKCGIFSKMLVEECFQSPDSVWSLYKRLVDKACELSKKKVESEPDDVTGLFHYASALVYRSRYEAAKNDWIGLMTDGVKSKKVLEKAIGLDPHFYDAYSGIGAFNYYAAHLPWYLKPVALVLGINGNEEEGIAELKKAAQFGDYSKAEAASFLADIVCKDKKNYPEMVRLALALHRQYPGNLDFVRTLCLAYYKLHDYDSVIRYSDPTLSKYKSSNSGRFLSLAYILFYRGESYMALKMNYPGAIADYSKAIEMGEPIALASMAYYGRGSLYERLGMKLKAVSDFETAIRLNGDDNACRLARVALDTLKIR